MKLLVTGGAGSLPLPIFFFQRYFIRGLSFGAVKG